MPLYIVGKIIYNKNRTYVRYGLEMIVWIL